MASRRAVDQLADEREHLLASISDLDAEHEAGEISDDDYAALRDAYVARAAASIRASQDSESSAVESTGSAGAPAREAVAGSPADAGTAQRDVPTMRRFRRFLGRRSVRRILWVCLVVSFAGLAIVLALALAGVRLPGQGVSGGVTLNQAQQIRSDLAQAQVLGSSGQVSEALSLYDQVLRADPRQPEALTYRGYLLCITGEATKSPAVVGIGLDSINEAIAADPGYGDAHFFAGLVLLQDYGRGAAALQQFEAALRHHASADLVKAERRPIEQLFESFHQPVPAAVSQG
jgi:tetratricopeptide (TPR) repeat protein